MANKQLESFSVLLDRHASPEKSLILGNGFGRSYDEAFGEKRFSWNTLAELCDIKSYPELFELLTECDHDFELVHQKLRMRRTLSRVTPQSAAYLKGLTPTYRRFGSSSLSP